MKDTAPARMRLYLDALEEQGYILPAGGEYPVLRLGAKAGGVLFRGEKVTMTERRPPPGGRNRPAAAPPAAKPPRAPQPPMRQGTARCSTACRALRAELAQQHHVPAYLIFPTPR